MASPRQSLPLDLLRCPRCRGSLASGAVVSCTACALEFPVLDGVPFLLVDPAAVQDPVTVVPLDAAARDDLRDILTLPAGTVLVGELGLA